MSEAFDITTLIETARKTAKQTHVDMTAAECAFEAIRLGNVKLLSPFALWDAIDEQIGKAETPSLQLMLIDFRTKFEQALSDSVIVSIEHVLTQSPDAGWARWLTVLADAVTRDHFRFGIRLCEHPFDFPDSQKREIENIRKAVSCMSQARWPEAYDRLSFIAAQNFLPDTIRAILLVYLGKIQLYYFQKTELAKESLESAEQLAPMDGATLSALGDYWKAERAIEKAELYYERAIAIAPQLPHGYIGRGECVEDKLDFDSAEDWYRKAIENAPGYSLGHTQLLKLYGRPELFISHKSDLESIVKKIIALSPEEEYSTYSDLSAIYQQNNQLETARFWLDKAIALDPTRPSGYVALAEWWETRGGTKEAEEAHKMAIEVAPECSDGYWGLTKLYEQQEKWQEALSLYEQMPQHGKDWAGDPQTKVAEMHWKLGDPEKAEALLRRVLQGDRSNVRAVDVLEAIAEDYCQHRDKPDEAKRLYSEILYIVGDSYKPTYHNLTGNLYYFLDQDELAAEEYRQAIAAAQDNPVYHRNLAKAYTKLKAYAEAEEELKQALELDKKQDKYNEELALVLNAEGNDYYKKSNYEEAIKRYTRAIEFGPNDAVIRSNLGGAWEQRRSPGKRLEELENAIAAFTIAHNKQPSVEYENTIERLLCEQELASRYSEQALGRQPVVKPIGIEVANNLIPLLVCDDESSLLPNVSRQIDEMRTRVNKRFGVHVPGVRFSGDYSPDGTYTIMIMEIPLVSGSIALDQRFFPGPQETLSSLNIMGQESITPLRGFWIDGKDWNKIEANGYELWDVIEYPIRHLEEVIQGSLVEFLGHQEVANLVEAEISNRFEHLRTQPEKLSALTAVCRGLAGEGVPIQPFVKILEAFDSQYSERASLQDIVEFIRCLPEFRSGLPGNDKRYSILPLGRIFETEIRNSIHWDGFYAALTMLPERCQAALTAVRERIEGNSPTAILVEGTALRPFIRLLTELEFPNVPVLSRWELSSDLQAMTENLIELEDNSPGQLLEKADTPAIETSDSTSHDSWEDGTPESNDATITVFVNEAFTAKQESADDQLIKNMFLLTQNNLFDELGIILPEMHLEYDNGLSINEFRFMLGNHKSPPIFGLAQDEIFVYAMSRHIRTHAALFQTVPLTQYMLNSLRTSLPALVDAALTRFSVGRICRILKDLLQEEISIRDLRNILESLLSIHGTIKVDLDQYIVFTPRTDNLCLVNGKRVVRDLTPTDYSNFVRAAHKRYISHKYIGAGSTLPVYLLSHKLEMTIRNSGARSATDEDRATLASAISKSVGNLPSTAARPVLLTNMDIRRTVRRLIEREFPDLAVVSYQELSPELSIQPLDRIS